MTHFLKSVKVLLIAFLIIIESCTNSISKENKGSEKPYTIPETSDQTNDEILGIWETENVGVKKYLIFYIDTIKLKSDGKSEDGKQFKGSEKVLSYDEVIHDNSSDYKIFELYYIENGLIKNKTGYYYVNTPTEVQTKIYSYVGERYTMKFLENNRIRMGQNTILKRVNIQNCKDDWFKAVLKWNYYKNELLNSLVARNSNKIKTLFKETLFDGTPSSDYIDNLINLNYESELPELINSLQSGGVKTVGLDEKALDNGYFTYYFKFEKDKWLLYKIESID